MKQIRITIFDDSKLVRDSLSQVINDMEEMIVVGTFQDCNNLLYNIELHNPDIVLMDINMPHISGIEGVKIIRQKFPKLPVLMQTIFDDDDHVFNAIAAGANGYILKNIESNKIEEAIHEALEGGAPMSPIIARKVLNFVKINNSSPEESNLSVREKEVLSYLVKGLSYKMIASKMSITYDTVRAHMKKIYEKLHVSSMTEAVAQAIHHKMFN